MFLSHLVSLFPQKRIDKGGALKQTQLDGFDSLRFGQHIQPMEGHEADIWPGGFVSFQGKSWSIPRELLWMDEIHFAPL